MSVQFSTARQNVTVTFTIDPGVQAWSIAQALTRLASTASYDYGVTIGDVAVVSVAPGERTVSMTESQYDALMAATRVTMEPAETTGSSE